MPHVTMLTSGNLVSLDKMGAAVIDIRDIAFGLSRINRWAGQSRHFYSVARHCLDVANRLYIPDDFWAACVALVGLLDDSEETYTGDIIAPVRELVPQFEELAKRIRRAVQAAITPKQACNLCAYDADVEAIIRGADLYQRAMEVHVLRGSPNAEYPDAKRGVMLSEPYQDEADFMRMYEHLCAEIGRLS